MTSHTRLGSCTALVAFFACLAGCSNASSSPQAADGGPIEPIARADVTRDPISAIPSGDLDAAVSANNSFALDLYARLEADAGAQNMFTSPISASLALTMAYSGAKGQTATEMATALHMGPAAGTSILNGQNALDQDLAGRGAEALASVMQNNSQVAVQYGIDAAAPSPSDYELQIVNSVWGEQTFAWSTAYLTVLAKSYGAGVYLQDFIHHPDQARDAINTWVSNETDDKIQNLIASLDPSTRMVLVNAIHLKFPWANPFDPSATMPGTFTRADGTAVSASLMSQQLTVPYTDDGQAQIVGVPLSGGHLSVVIALPHQGTSLQSYESAMTARGAALAVPQSQTNINLSIPKVTFTTATFSLKPALQAMGMNLAFTQSADFSGMVSGGANAGLLVFDVLQKTTISMQETGVEAAAATAVIIVATAEEIPAATMIVNRPYLVAIVDVPTGAILFLGQIDDPTTSG